MNDTRGLSGIYLILNKVTLYNYIGSASTGRFHARFSNHLFNFHGSKVVKNAVKKHGISSFAFIVLELFPEIVNKENNKKLLDLEEEIKKNSFIQKINFKTWDYCSISKENNIKSCLEHPLYMKIDKMEWQLINNSLDNVDIQKYINFDIELNNGIKRKHLIYKDFIELQENLIQFMKKYNKSLSEDELYLIAVKLYSLKHYYVNQKENKHIDKNLNEILEEYYSLKEELNKMNLTKSQLEQKASFKAKLFILIAPLIFLVQLILIYIGTFQIYSWDIIEPMTYLMSIANFIGILYFRKKIGSDTTHNHYKKIFFSKYVKRKQFDMDRYLSLKDRIEKFENSLN